MPYDAFTHVDYWVFDLDNTLYPPQARLFDQIERLMANYVMRELKVDSQTAHALRKKYWKEYGTTLAGLMHVHNIDPDPYLHEVHQLDLSNIQAAPDLRDAISALPGRKIIYTNGSRAHGKGVSGALGLDGVFDAIYGVEDAGYTPKPDRAAFQKIFSTDGINTERAAMFEDDVRNLAIPHQMGMKTVLVGPNEIAPHIQHQTEDLAAFLMQLVEGPHGTH
ncbi:MAG: pyrimidine 5'-nucleotidase [Rhodobacteraceae bacterium]|nr:pyrimidine 5'-nucleotidase [Paracoccaceae bacterium]